MKLSSLIEGAEPQPTQEMVDFYEKRTKEHIDRVNTNIDKVEANTDYKLGDREHDASKYGKEERLPYIWLTEYHRCKNEGKDFTYPPGIEEKVEAATGHHIKTNRHHPEAHENIEDMTDEDIIEMVCDWTAMSQELGQDGGSAKGWADKNVGTKWKFTDAQRDLIYKIIGVLEK